MHFTKSSSSTARLPLAGLLTLAATAFLGVLTETLPAGLLLPMSAELDVSQAQIGQLVTVYALVAAITAIPLTKLTLGVPRRVLLLVIVSGYAVVNLVTATSSSYLVIVAARAVGGTFTGLMWAMLAGYAIRMVAPQQSGRALAIAMVGTPLAFALGLPLGNMMSGMMGWRLTFAALAGVSLLLVVLILALLPAFPGESAVDRPSLRAVVRTPGLIVILATTATFVLAHNIAYTYIAPIMKSSGLQERLDLVLLIFGVSAILGVVVVGALVDRHLRRLSLVSIIGFGLAMLAVGVENGSPAAVFVAVGLWGLAYGGIPTLFQTAPAKVSGTSAEVAQSMVVMIWNLCIALGAVVGGGALERFGPQSLPWLAAAVALPSFVLVLLGRRNAFPRRYPVDELIVPAVEDRESVLDRV